MNTNSTMNTPYSLLKNEHLRCICRKLEYIADKSLASCVRSNQILDYEFKAIYELVNRIVTPATQ